MRVQYGGVSDSVSIEPAVVPAKRVRRTAEQKRRIVEASLVAGVSIARVAREHGVNANQLFQWRYEYRKGNLGSSQAARPELMAVSLAAEPPALAMTQPASIHIDLPGRASIRVEAGMDPELVRIVLGSLLR
jgi:transposase